MQFLLCGTYLLLVTTVGYVGACFVIGRATRHWAELIGMSFAAGAGICSAILFVTSLAGVVPSRILLALIAALALMGFIVVARRNRWLIPSRPGPLPRQWEAWEIAGALAALLIVIASINTAIVIFTPGISDIDAYAIWMLKAKIAATEPLRPVPGALMAPSLSFSHQDYPLGFPLLIAGAYAAIGAVDVPSIKLVLATIFLSFVAVIYGALRRVLRRAEALIVTALLVASPIVRQQSSVAVAEMLLVLLVSCFVVQLWRWMETGQRRELLACGAFAAFAAFAKNEGLALLPLVCTIALLYGVARRRPKLLVDWLVAAVIALAIIAPWLAYRRLLPRTQEDYGGKLLSPTTIFQDLPRVDRVLPGFAKLFVQFNEAGPIWIVLVIIAITGWRAFGRWPVVLLWIFLITHLLLYALTFMISPWKPEVLMPMIGPKLLLHAMPMAAVLIALHLATISSKRWVSSIDNCANARFS